MLPSRALSCGPRFCVFSILVTLFCAQAFAPGALAATETDTWISESPGQAWQSHKITGAEMLAYKAAMGIRDPAADYNIIIDGHGTGKAPPTEEAYEKLVGEMNLLDSVEPMALPSALDLSTSPSFPKVGNQEMQGSCTAWAVTYYAYGYMEAVDNGWTQAKTGNTSHLLSPAWTYNKVNGGVDRGSWEWDNMMVLKDWGASTMANLPYDDGDWIEWGSPTAFREAPLHRIYEAYRIPYVGATTVETVKTLISEGVPVTFGLDASEYTQAFMDGGYVMSASEYNSKRPNHANTFIGYDDSVSDDGETGAFRVANSWGSTWGDGGYYWLTYEAFMEIGSWDLLDLCFVEDRADYSPTMTAVWQFDPAPSRDVQTIVAIGTFPGGNGKSPYYWLSTDPDLRFPSYMCLDITEFQDHYDSGMEEFYINLNATVTPGTLEGLKVELFESTYVPGAPTHSSGDAWNDPQAVPGFIATSFQYYSQVELGDALDTALAPATEGDVHWVGVDHEWSYGGDSAQSGNIGDSEYSRLTAVVLGPLDVAFEWKVSSELNGDYLSFEVDSLEQASVSGDVDWQAESFSVGPGTHTISWTYSKDAAGSDLDDCGWVDRLTVGPPDLEAPVADAGEDFECVLAKEILLDGTGSTDNVGVVNWTWSFDDGVPNTLYGAQVSYAFEHHGPHVVQLQVRDAAGNGDSDTVLAMVLAPPVAEYTFSPALGDTTTLFEFDASASYDAEDPDEFLTVRWDWDSDGTWDTGWSSELTAYHIFASPGDHLVSMEVADSDGLTDTYALQVTVAEAIPEFGQMLVPTMITLIAAIVCVMRRRAKQGRDS